jgi:four helix bundle protein
VKIAECRVPNSSDMNTENHLKARTKKFAFRVFKIIEALPTSRKSRIICDQLGRTETVVGANYRASCRARSRAEFIAKIGIVEEEADESAYRLELTMQDNLLPSAKVQPLHVEANELSAIMAASCLTAARNR